MLLNYALLVANLLALALLTFKGGRFERIAALLVLGTVIAEPFAAGLHIGTWRIGIVAVNAALLCGLWILAELADRWWLILAAALQLILVLTALMPLMGEGFATQTGVIVRLALWTLISAVLFLGVWEAWADRRFAREARP